MIIEEIYIRSFGKFKDFKIQLADGFNVIYGANEAGKSTLLAFIRCMLYGTRDRKRYLTDENPSASGTLTFSHEGKRYHLDRTFSSSKKDDTVRLQNADTGKMIPVPLKQEPGEWLFDLTEEAFLNTVYVAQLSCPFDGAKVGDSVVTKLSNIHLTGDEKISFAQTDEHLKRAANSLEFRNKGKIPELRERLAALEDEQRNLNISEEMLKERQNAFEALKDKKAELERKKSNCENYISICEQKLFLSEVSEIRKLHDTVQNKERELYSVSSVKNDNAQDENTKIKNLYNECSKAQAIVEKCEIDFSESNKRYKELCEECGQAQKLKDVDFEEFNAILSELNMTEDDAEAEEVSPVPLVGIICSLILSAIFVFLSVSRFLMLIPAIVFAGSALVFALFYKKNGAGVPSEEEIEEDEKDLEDILTRADCRNVEELLQKKAIYDTYLPQLSEVDAGREDAIEKLRIARQKQKLLQCQLFSALEPFAVVSDMNAAEETISQIDGIDRESLVFKNDISVLKAKLEALLRERDYNLLLVKADEIEQKFLRIRNLEQFDPEMLEACKNELAEINQRLQEVSSDSGRLEGVLSGTKTEKTPQTVQEEIDEVRNQLKQYEYHLSVLQLARKAMEDANEEMSLSFAPGVNDMSAKILSEITCGKYDDMRVSADLEPVIFNHDSNSFMNKLVLSGGTVDQLYLSLRLAVSEKIFNGEPLPLMLDEAMAQYDDVRMQRTVAYLKTLRQQILMFSCRQSEVDAACSSGNVYLIKL